jgi:hypothetical protein
VLIAFTRGRRNVRLQDEPAALGLPVMLLGNIN